MNNTQHYAVGFISLLPTVFFVANPFLWNPIFSWGVAITCGVIAFVNIRAGVLGKGK